MATLYLRDDATTWGTANSWSTTSASVHTGAAIPTISDDCIAELLSGNVTISSGETSPSCKSFSCTGGTGNYAGTLTHQGASFLTWNLGGGGNFTFSTEMTYAPDSLASITLNTGCSLTTAGKLMPPMSMITFGQTVTLIDNLSFTALKTNTLRLANGVVFNMNGKSINGNSATNRLLIYASVIGTAQTITNATTAFTNADFRDITFSSGVSLDLSAISGLSGDCGGNTITGGGSTLTFTTAATQTYTGGTDNWSTAARWTSRVPLPQDNVLMSGVTGGTVTADMPRLGKSIDWTGASGGPTFAASNGGAGFTFYGSWTFISGMTVTSSTSMVPIFETRTTSTLTSAGKSFYSGNFAMFGGTITLNDSMSFTNNTTNFANGTIVGNGFDASFFDFTDNNTAATKTINLGSGTWGVTRNTTHNWRTSGSGTTVIQGSSTISIGVGGFTGGGKTYNNILLTGSMTFNDANTYNRIFTNGSGTMTITLPGSATTTILSGAGLANGTNVITFTPSAGSATISKSGGVVSWDYVNLTNIPSTGGATFYAGANSTDGGGNTGWIFAAAPGTIGIDHILSTQGWI